jgi:hypothetical protein
MSRNSDAIWIINELWHTCLVCAFTLKYLADSAYKDLDIQPQALALDVCNIKLEALIEIQVAAPGYLP